MKRICMSLVLVVALAAVAGPAVAAFLDSLTGKQPKIVYPLLPASREATPHPVL